MAPMVFDSNKTKNLDNSLEYSRILTAAIVSSQFRQLLLSNPAKAIAAGFGGEAFNLDSEDCKRLSSIRATNLADFASQLKGYPTGPIGYSSIAAD
ncbi:MAG TPA: hypothetical protein PKD23_08155 [Bellilinea sp.]|jgi:hypothetical protein|nr:hypothetical protein [Bellilinea sp.]